ncbi:MAG: hypothetical protein KAT65_28215, partial [Methanophagales archaeon]|nr:hypothetical protein [Methanophagales archaeon]
MRQPLVVWQVVFIAISLLFQSPPPSVHTNHKPACKSMHQQFLSAVRAFIYQSYNLLIFIFYFILFYYEHPKKDIHKEV